MIDLHIHSTYSDGTCSPADIIKKVTEKGLYGFSLTDHDTTEGIPKIIECSIPQKIHFLPGIEISCDTPKHEIHILGYGINYKSETLIQTLSDLRQKRMQRNLDMIALFQKDGYPITLEKLHNGNPNTVITRAHFSRVLIEEGICKNSDQAFKKYLGNTCKYYLPKPFFHPKDALKLILDANGSPVLAHPFQYHFSNLEIENLIRELMTYGLKGLEIYHSTHHLGQITKLLEWQKKYHLLGSGGSDFHGNNKPDIVIGTGRGGMYVPDHLFNLLEHASAGTL